MAPLLPFVILVKKHSADCNTNVEDQKKLKQVSVTIHQILCQLENIPQIFLLFAFISINHLNKYGDTGVELNIIPEGNISDWVTIKYWFFFILSMFMSCYSAMTSLVECSTMMKVEEPGLVAKLYLIISFACQIISRISPTTTVCLLKIFCDASDLDFPLELSITMVFLPLLIRWLFIWVIYKWLASAQTIERFQDLSNSEKFIHVMTNSYIINPVRPVENEDTKPRKREHILLFGLSIVDALLHSLFWNILSFIFSFMPSDLAPYLLCLTILPVGFSLGGALFLWMYYRKANII